MGDGDRDRGEGLNVIKMYEIHKNSILETLVFLKKRSVTDLPTLLVVTSENSAFSPKLAESITRPHSCQEMLPPFRF